MTVPLGVMAAAVTTGVTPPPTDPYYDAVMASSPVMYWRFRDTADGTVVAEVGPNATSVNLVAVEQPGPAAQSLAFQFNGSSSTVNVTSGVEAIVGVPSPIAATGAWVSVECWVKTSAATQGLIMYDSGSGANRPWVAVMASGVLEAYPNNQVGPVFDGTTALDDNAWHHLVVSMQGGTDLGTSDGQVLMYVDGAVEGEFFTASKFPASAGLDSLIIGAFAGGAGKFTGLMTEVAVYNQLLDSTEVAAHYSAMFA